MESEKKRKRPTAEQLAGMVLDFADAEALGDAFLQTSWTPEEAVGILTGLARDPNQKGNVRVAAIKLLSLIGKQALEAQGYIASFSQKRMDVDPLGNLTLTTARTARILQNRKQFLLESDLDSEPPFPEETNNGNEEKDKGEKATPVETEAGADNHTGTDRRRAGDGSSPTGSLLGSHRPPEETGTPSDAAGGSKG